jgi:hypothetical protein
VLCFLALSGCVCKVPLYFFHQILVWFTMLPLVALGHRSDHFDCLVPGRTLMAHLAGCFCLFVRWESLAGRHPILMDWGMYIIGLFSFSFSRWILFHSYLVPNGCPFWKPSRFRTQRISAACRGYSHPRQLVSASIMVDHDAGIHSRKEKGRPSLISCASHCHSWNLLFCLFLANCDKCGLWAFKYSPI